MPAASRTARTEPPAMTPVPCEAGFSSTLDAEKVVRTSWGIVVPTIGMRMRCFFASSTPFRIASGTSPALPSPQPTWPAPSPTTTTALKLKRRPPLTTFATRLIWTTRSSRVSLLGSILATWAPCCALHACRLAAPALFRNRGRPRGRRRQATSPPVVPVPGPIEDDALDPAVFARSATSRPTTLASSVLVCFAPRRSFSRVDAAASVRPDESSITWA